MERRKLFSAMPSDFAPRRRKIFSDIPEPQEPETCVVVCQDCGYELTTPASTTELICPNCGGHRFNHPSELETPAKTFSRKSLHLRRRSLFSALGENEIETVASERTWKCLDCGITFSDPNQLPSGPRCPECGGNRVVLVGPDEEAERDFSDSTDSTDEFLKCFSGKTMTADAVQKEFGERGIKESLNDFLMSGYASINDSGQVCFSDCADIQRKLFSKLVISVTKELELDPVDSREALIQKLADSGRLPEKSVILIRKAIPTPPIFETENTEDYIKDSGISNDLRLEHGGSRLPLREFMDIMNTQYNDAPENIIDQLVKRGIINISGSQVEVNK